MSTPHWQRPNWFVFTCAVAIISFAAFADSTRGEEVSSAENERDLPAGRLTFGGEFRQSEFEGFADALIPLVATETGLVFLNPRTSITDRSEEEYNLGLGYRHLFADRNLILGGNIFYDYRDTRFGNTYHQLGLGVEMLTPWVDARANYYRPERKTFLADTMEVETVQESRRRVSTFGDLYAEGNAIRQDETVRNITTTTTTKQTFEMFEQAVEGFDAEIGVKFPMPEAVENVEVRLFGGYYYFDSRLGDDIKGAKARLEVRALPSLFLDAGWYENKDLTGSDFYVGARINVPFDLYNLAQGRNPFAGARDGFRHTPRPFAARMTEMVMRDLHVRDVRSDYIENESLREVETSSRNNSRVISHSILGDVAFVDGDSTGSELGTAEAPFQSIAQGIESAHRNVYVFATSGPYRENVTIDTPKTIIGQGHAIRGFDGKQFGGDEHTVISGQRQGPAIVIHGGHGTTIAGMRIVNIETDIAPSGPLLDPVFAGVGYRGAGIYVRDTDNVTIINNQFFGTTRGLWFAIRGDNTPDFSARVMNNAFVLNTQGLYLQAGARTALGGGSLDTFSLSMTDNIFALNAVGADLRMGVADSVAIFGQGNTFTLNANAMDIRRLAFTPTPDYAIDFGGGVLGSAGQNIIFNNTMGFGSLLIPDNTISVGNNFWGGGAPGALDLMGAGYQLPTTWLTSAP